MRDLLKHSAHWFALLGIIFIPASSYVFAFQDQLAKWIFGPIVSAFVSNDFGFSSDSAALYSLVILLIPLALLSSLGFGLFTEDNKHQQLIQIIRLLVVYYLASRFLIYGFDKIFKAQFYLPEPNILYTPFGMLSKDISFWSLMGTSKMYNVLTGIAEIIPAVLLLFRRTRVLGSSLLFLLLIHILTINLSFDISVKLYTLFLLFLSALIIGPHWKQLLNFFLKGESAKLESDGGHLSFLYQPKTRATLKTFVFGVLLIEALHFPLSTGSVNDDSISRPLYHGAYEIVSIKDDGGAEVESLQILERFFIHRRSYLIYQFKDDQMVDYVLKDTEYDSIKVKSKNSEDLNNIYFSLYADETILQISDILDGVPCTISGRRLNWQELPLLQDDFHWTIDEVE